MTIDPTSSKSTNTSINLNNFNNLVELNQSVTTEPTNSNNPEENTYIAVIEESKQVEEPLNSSPKNSTQTSQLIPQFKYQKFLSHQHLKNQIDEEVFSCNICLGVPFEPLFDPCGHSFCKSCLIQMTQNEDGIIICPGTGEKYFLNNLTTNPQMERYINKQACWCIHNHLGCQWEGQVKELRVHLETDCSEKEVNCPNEGCSFFERRRIVNIHSAECEYRRVVCSLCSMLVALIEEKNHGDVCPRFVISCLQCDVAIERGIVDVHIENECPKTIIGCQFIKYGCNVRLEREFMRTHLLENNEMHMNLMVNTKLQLMVGKFFEMKEISEIKGILMLSENKNINENIERKEINNGEFNDCKDDKQVSEDNKDIQSKFRQDMSLNQFKVDEAEESFLKKKRKEEPKPKSKVFTDLEENINTNNDSFIIDIDIEKDEPKEKDKDKQLKLKECIESVKINDSKELKHFNESKENKNTENTKRQSVQSVQSIKSFKSFKSLCTIDYNNDIQTKENKSRKPKSSFSLTLYSKDIIEKGLNWIFHSSPTVSFADNKCIFKPSSEQVRVLFFKTKGDIEIKLMITFFTKGVALGIGSGSISSHNSH